MILWRHGETQWNRDARVQGQTDVPLSETGREQAATIAAKLAAVRPGAIISSDLSRAADTAAALGALTGLPVRTDPRLRERYFGEFQGLSAAEIAARWPKESARWHAGEAHVGRGVEDLDDVAKRMAEAFRDAADRHAGGTVVIATHGGAARVGCGALLGWPPALVHTIAILFNCHWTELRFDPVRGWQLRGHNLGG